MTRKFVVVHEAPADFNTATQLADREIVDRVGRLESESLHSPREWLANSSDGARFTWTSLPDQARKVGIRVRGHFDGEPGLPDAKAARRAIEFVRKVVPDLAGVLLIRDCDNQRARRIGLEQARQDAGSRHIVVIGLCVHERESWVLSGFLPRDEGERQRLKEARAELGFDPTMQPQELTATKNDRDKRSPKRILAALTSSDLERQHVCWQEAPLETLRERGSGNGLAEFLAEIRDRLVPLITGYSPDEPTLAVE